MNIVTLMKKLLAAANAKGAFGLTAERAFAYAGMTPHNFGPLGGSANELESRGLWVLDCPDTGNRYFYLAESERNDELETETR